MEWADKVRLVLAGVVLGFTLGTLLVLELWHRAIRRR